MGWGGVRKKKSERMMARGTWRSCLGAAGFFVRGCEGCEIVRLCRVKRERKGGGG